MIYLNSYSESLIKTLVIIVLAGMIGYNREKRGMNAGIRTHILVGLSAVLVQLISLNYSIKSGYSGDELRMAGQLLTSLGFICSGVILKGDKTIRGLTTAASIFFIACVGLAVGSGFYFLAITMTLVAYLFLIDAFRLKKSISLNKDFHITVKIKTNGLYSEYTKEITDMFNSMDIEISSIDSSSAAGSEAVLNLKTHDEINTNEILANLMNSKFIIKAEKLDKK